MYLHNQSDASAMGAVLLAFNALKQEVAFSQAAEKVFEPSTEHAETYRKAYGLHGKLYEALRGVFLEMN